MATNTYYSTEYTYRSNYKYRAALTLTTSSTATNYTVSWTIAVQAQHGYLYGMAVTGSGECSGTASGYLTSSPGSTWKTVSSKSGSKTYTKTTSSQAKSFTAKAYGTVVNGIGSAGGSGVSITQKITIPALASYTITYDPNGGSGGPGKQTKYYGTTVTLSSTAPTKANYKFIGWYSAGGTKYTTYSGNASITFYAHWEATGNTITYNPNGGTTLVKTQYKTKGINFVPSVKANPSRVGYDFIGWYTDPVNGQIVNNDFPYTTDADLTLYAHWEKITYIITYFSTETGTTAPESSEKEYGVDAVLANPTYPTGYVFLGWATTENGEVVYFPNSSYRDNANINLYAIYGSSYISPRIGNLSCIRLDTYGVESDGGERIKLAFNSMPAKDSPTASANNTHVIVFKSEDDENYTILDQYNTVNGENSKVYDSEDNVSIDGYSYFKIIATDISKFTITEDTEFDETKDYYTRISVTSDGSTYYYFEKIDNPSGIPSGEFELSESSAIQEYLINRVKINAVREVNIINNTIVCERNSSTSTTGNLSFNFTPFYDGNTPYLTTVFNIYYKFFENDSESEAFSTDITKTVIINANDYYGENDRVNQHEISFNLDNLPIGKKIQIILNIESFSNDSPPKRYPEEANEFYSIEITKTISVGGFVFHINESGNGMSFFGIATPELNGIEINKPFILNSEATLNNKVTLNDRLEVNEEATFDKINIKHNGLTIDAIDRYGIVLQQNTIDTDAGIKISRADKNFHLFCGIGDGGVNHGIWSEADPRGWIIHKNNGFVYANNGKVLLNSNNVLLTSTGAYMTGGQDYYFKNKQTVLQQMLGVVLVWSHYTPGNGPKDWGWQYTFIPKWHVQTHGGQGIYIKLQAEDSTTDTYKYIYLYNDHIKGNAVNGNYGTGYDNRLACLRAVIGV